MAAWKTQTNIEDKIVLVVSRDSKMASAWTMLFKQRGFILAHETSPRHALQAARLLAPALTIVDLDLTQPEQLSLCKELRPVTRALLLLAPKSNADEISEYYCDGVDERLSPTISPMNLVSKSLVWLARQQIDMPRAQLREFA